MRVPSKKEAREMAERLMQAYFFATPGLEGALFSSEADEQLYLKMYEAMPDILSVLITYSEEDASTNA